METPASHVLRINVPGLGKDDVKVQVEEGNVLTVRGAPPAGKGEKGDEDGAVWHVAERGKPEFARAVALPENVRVDGIRAGVENGVLTVVVPKEPVPARPKPRPIAVHTASSELISDGDAAANCVLSVPDFQYAAVKIKTTRTCLCDAI